MYFQVSDAFLARREQLPGCSVAIGNLINAVRAGHHFLVMSRDLADAVIADCDLSRSQIEIIDGYIKTRFTVLRSEVRNSSIYVECMPDAYSSPCEANAVQIRLRSFDDPTRLGPSRLMVEDANKDAPAVSLLIDVFTRFFVKGRRTSLDYLHGGGSATAENFEREGNSPRPLLCVADSDSRFPGGPYGDTARKVLEIEKNLPYATSKVVVWPVREVENIFPLRVIKIVYESLMSIDVATACQDLIDFCESGQETDCRNEYVCFLDFKEGLKEKDVASASAAGHISVLRQLWAHANGAAPSPDLLDPDFLDKNPFKGLARGLLEVVVRELRDKPHLMGDVARNFRKHPKSAEVEHVVRLVLDVGAAPTPLPIRAAA